MQISMCAYLISTCGIRRMCHFSQKVVECIAQVLVELKELQSLEFVLFPYKSIGDVQKLYTRHFYPFISMDNYKISNSHYNLIKE